MRLERGVLGVALRSGANLAPTIAQKGTLHPEPWHASFDDGLFQPELARPGATTRDVFA
jgi:hypothetical protein